jgi:hypothetical protein
MLQGGMLPSRESMDLFEELTQLIAAFDAGGVDYAVCGALALAIHGLPRATKDIDVLVEAAAIDRVRTARLQELEDGDAEP